MTLDVSDLHRNIMSEISNIFPPVALLPNLKSMNNVRTDVGLSFPAPFHSYLREIHLICLPWNSGFSESTNFLIVFVNLRN